MVNRQTKPRRAPTREAQLPSTFPRALAVIETRPPLRPVATFAIRRRGPMKRARSGESSRLPALNRGQGSGLAVAFRAGVMRILASAATAGSAALAARTTAAPPAGTEPGAL